MSNMICDECETVFHCLRNGCIPKQPAQQEPVAIVDDSGVIVVCSYHYKPGGKLYTVPPAQRNPLTDEELEEIVKRGAENKPFHHWFARAIEAAHGIKESI